MPSSFRSFRVLSLSLSSLPPVFLRPQVFQWDHLLSWLCCVGYDISPELLPFLEFPPRISASMPLQNDCWIPLLFSRVVWFSPHLSLSYIPPEFPLLSAYSHSAMMFSHHSLSIYFSLFITPFYPFLALRRFCSIAPRFSGFELMFFFYFSVNSSPGPDFWFFYSFLLVLPRVRPSKG